MAAQAKRDPAMGCNNVLHVIDRACLRAAYRQTRQKSAPGVEQVTATQYADNLDDNLRALHERLRDHRSVAPPVERGWLEQDDGQQRPIGTPCCEATLVQRAVVLIVEAIFDQDLHAVSHGFRKGHSQHHARHEPREPCRTLPMTWRGDADVSGFVDHPAWDHLRECITQRVHEGGILRRIGTWLHAGVLEAGALTHPDKGAPQGGVGAPRVSHIFLHHVLDAGCVKAVRPRRKGRGFVTRFADDCRIGGALEADAHRVRAVWPKRCKRFGLTIPPAKPAGMACKKPPSRAPSARGRGTCDVLGCTHSWAKTRRGYWGSKRKTVRKRLRRCMRALWPWSREHRHAPLQEP